jgi:hypothetical protein
MFAFRRKSLSPKNRKAREEQKSLNHKEQKSLNHEDNEVHEGMQRSIKCQWRRFKRLPAGQRPADETTQNPGPTRCQSEHLEPIGQFLLRMLGLLRVLRVRGSIF